MRILAAFTLTLLFMVADASSRAVAASTPPAGDARDAAVRREVQALAGLLSDGIPALVKASVRIKYAPPPGPGDPEAVGSMGAVALFSMEGFGGGNNFHQFLVVFEHGNREDLPPKSPFREWRLQGFTHVGERGTRAFDDIRIEKDRIILTGESWDLSKDAMCCPSGIARASYRFAPYSLTEIPMPAKDPPRPAQESSPRGGRLSPDGNPEGS